MATEQPTNLATTPSASISPELPTLQGKRRKITTQDVESLANLLITRRMTETEACAVLGIVPKVWFTWKERKASTPEFEGVLARTRGSYIHARIADIEDGAAGRGAHKRADWRAADRLLGIVDPARFGQQQPQEASRAPSVPTVTVSLAVQMVYGQKQPQVADATEVKALPMPTTTQEAK